jgi:hypothetical protein
MKIDKGDIKLNFFDDILGYMDKDQKLDLASMLVYDDDVLDSLVTELMTGYASPTTDSHIHKARMRFIELMPEGAANLIRALVAEVARSKADEERMRDDAYNLYQRYPQKVTCQNPGCGTVFTFHPPERKKWEMTSTPTADKIMAACGLKPIANEVDIPV